MRICKTIKELRAIRQSLPKEVTVGFVPTMGALHQGHLKLVEISKAANPQACWASIFVNPAQFAPHEDFSKYPRTFEKDAELLEKKGVQVLFYPEPKELYPSSLPGATSINVQKTYVVPMGVEEDQAEGRARPGHFRGVATVVTKLFNIVQPTNAYFGQKDGLQCIVIKQLVRELNMPVNVVACDTIREADGLAMSSRNIYLSKEQRARAPVLYQALSAIRDGFNKKPASTGFSKKELVGIGKQVLKEDLFKIEYISIVDGDSGVEVKDQEALSPNGYYMCSAAINFGNCRILDNVLLGKSKFGSGNH